MSLSGVVYLVIGAYLVAITAFGSWFARFQKTTRDYFLTDRSVPWWAICFTIVATETSTLTFIGIPAQAYTGNMTFLQLALGYVFGRILVSALFIPAYFRGDLFTSYELLQRRFGTRVKTLSAVIFLITRSLADGIRLFTTALVIGAAIAMLPAAAVPTFQVNRVKLEFGPSVSKPCTTTVNGIGPLAGLTVKVTFSADVPPPLFPISVVP